MEATHGGATALGARPAATVTRLGRRLGRAMAPFDRIYGADLNPLRHAGTLALLFLLVATVSGIYLFLFYRVADPYGSVLAIEERVWGGAFVRALHRYSADCALVAALVHAARRIALGHTWGPRLLAWVSGLLLAGTVLLCGWTGMVMAWDVQGYLVALEGARLLDLLPIFSEPIRRSFTLPGGMSSSFFFMNLFLHVALPLGLAGLFWLHVSRLARPAVRPPRALLRGALLALALVALVWPAPLPPPADPLEVPAAVPTDLFYAFWLPLARELPPAAHLALWLGLGGLGLALPWLLRPRGAAIAPSTVDEARCTGCTQCYEDCPYEAISMVVREEPSRLSEVVARVDPQRCVGCGLCTGSCAPMGVGPPGRSGREQLAAARAFLDERLPGPRQVVLLACGHGLGDDPRLTGLDGVIPYPIGCSGSVHTSVVELLLRRGAGGVYLLTCPGRACLYREGPRWLAERLYHDREAELQERVDRRRVRLASFAASEGQAARRALEAFRDAVRRLDRPDAESDPQLDLECEPPDEARLREALGP